MAFSLLARSSRALRRPLQDGCKRWASAATATAAEPANAVNDSVTALPLFSTLTDKISPLTLKAITVKPFALTTMSPVQAQVLPRLPALAEPDSTQPRDLLVRAKTGTGKTLAFLVPAIEARVKSVHKAGHQAVLDAGLTHDTHLAARAARTFAGNTVGTLIISPTRELATQIATEALKLSEHHDGFGVQLFVGGNSKRQQLSSFMRGRKDIVVGTPGRLRDVLHSEPSVSKPLSTAQLLVLDEADTLLDMGFRDDIEDIKSFLPKQPERQTFLFSATVSAAIQQIARSTLSPNHAYIDCVNSDDSPVHAHIPQHHTVLPSASEQIPHILRLLAHDQLSNPTSSKVIIFAATTKMTQLLTTTLRQLAGSTLPAGRASRIYEIHSKRTQEARTQTSSAFRADKSGASVLVTSDVSARGVDYPGVTRVIQVGMPGTHDTYVHRVGRTGRAGASAGRGDLVLLPFEAGFVKYVLNGVTIKSISTTDLESEVAVLAQNTKCEKVILGIKDTVQTFLPQLDTAAVEETFGSLLGYYISKNSDVRTTKEAILDGCKEWATGAFGMADPPHVSRMFLAKLGMSSGGGGGRGGYGGKSSGGFGLKKGSGYNSEWNPSGGNSNGRSAPWMDRGSSGGGRDSGRSSYGSRDSFGGSSGGYESKGSYGTKREGGYGGKSFGGGEGSYSGKSFGGGERKNSFERKGRESSYGGNWGDRGASKSSW